jgi:hypothetical protein
MDMTGLIKQVAVRASLVLLAVFATSVACSESNGEGGDHDTTNGGGESSELWESRACREACTSDSDCAEDAEFKCIDGFCFQDVDIEDRCQSHDDCVRKLGSWASPCAGDEDCRSNEVCIEHDGDGLCAYDANQESCEAIHNVVVSKPRYAASGDVEVCGQPLARCHPGFDSHGRGFASCVVGCDTDGDCTQSGWADTCVDGFCRCSDDASCERVFGADVCIDGTCSCSGDAFCEGIGFDGCR